MLFCLRLFPLPTHLPLYQPLVTYVDDIVRGLPYSGNALFFHYQIGIIRLSEWFKEHDPSTSPEKCVDIAFSLAEGSKRFYFNATRTPVSVNVEQLTCQDSVKYLGVVLS